jgi:hypothetical protein
MVLYGVLCLIALWFIPASVYGWLGIERDPLAAVFALLLAMPWSLLLRRIGDHGVWFSGVWLAIGMAINLWLLWLLQRWWRR